LPFVAVTLTYRGQQLNLNDVVVDTGSAGTIFPIDKVEAIGILPETQDPLHRIRGVGAAEFVFKKRVHSLTLGELEVRDFEVEIGAMDYGFQIEGIVGMDFLMQAGAIIDLAQLEIYGASETGDNA